jgi:hypothetical protein
MAIEWAAENLRISLFSNQAVQVTDLDWRAITGQEEAETRKVVPGGRVFSGPFEDTLLSFAGTMNRADIVMSCAPELSTELPTIGPWETTRERFFRLTSEWISAVRFPITRVAFGAVLLCPTTGRKEAYAYLKKLLSSVEVNPDEMRELIYRINWPTNSESIRGLSINRITQWSVIRLTVKAVQLGESQADTKISESNAMRLEIDHSTDEARTELIDHKKVIPLYKELVTLAIQNASRGERP